MASLFTYRLQNNLQNINLIIYNKFVPNALQNTAYSSQERDKRRKDKAEESYLLELAIPGASEDPGLLGSQLVLGQEGIGHLRPHVQFVTVEGSVKNN